MNEARGSMRCCGSSVLQITDTLPAWERAYLALLAELLDAPQREGRNGATRGVFGRQLRVDLSECFPAPLTKKLWLHGVRTELVWMLRGGQDTAYLHEHGVHIWDANADEDGALGPVYGAQWRGWLAANGGGFPRGQFVDQWAELLEGLRKDPTSRRHIMTTWNVSELPDMQLPPCHGLTLQVYVEPTPEGPRVSVHQYQRSADAFLGLPFNIASYAMLTHLLAHELDGVPGDVILSLGDVHLYAEHEDAAREQIRRGLEGDYSKHALPYMARLRDDMELVDTEHECFPRPEDLRVHCYTSDPAIKARMVP